MIGMPKAHVFAGAGRCLGENVMPVQHGRYGLLLDGSRGGEAHLDDSLQGFWLQVHGFKGYFASHKIDSSILFTLPILA